MRAGMEMLRKCFYRACSSAHSTVRSSTASGLWNAVSGKSQKTVDSQYVVIFTKNSFRHLVCRMCKLVNFGDTLVLLI